MNQCQHFNMAIKKMVSRMVTPTPSNQYVLCFDVTSAYTATLRFTQVSDDEATIDWGDGSATQTSGTGTTVAITHSYAVGSYTLTISSDNIADIVLCGYGRGRTVYNCLYIQSSASISLTSITIPSSVTSLGDYAFSRCTGLTSITIPSSVTSLGNSAFYNCRGLTSITIPSSVTSLGDYAFYGCSSLTSITIPSSVTSLGDSAFSMCTGLTSYDLQLDRYVDNLFLGCTGLTSIIITDNITYIANQTFYGCSNVTSVTFNNVTPPTIISTAFNEMQSTGTVYVPTGTTAAYTTALSSTGLSGWTIVEQ